MTKRDVADIVFAAIGIVFLFTLVQSLMSFAFYLGLNDQGSEYTDKSISIIFSALHSVILASLCYMLIVRRGTILDIVFRKDEDRIVDIPEGLSAITQYSFWIRLIGAYMFLKAGTEFFGLLTVTLASKQEFSSFSYNGRTTWQLLIVTLLSIIVVSKAEYIASILERKRGQHAS